jgi:uncharacterized protein YaiL (DUF2058 family)
VQSLREKLIRAGLITEAAADQPAEEKAQARNQAPIHPLLPLALPGSKAHQRLTALQQLERDKRLRELVLATQVPLEPGECAFHFVTRKGKVRRLELSEAQAKLLADGALAVVERPEPAQIEHSLVPSQTADQMLKLFEKSVRFYNREGDPIGLTRAEDEPAPNGEPDGA